MRGSLSAWIFVLVAAAGCGGPGTLSTVQPGRVAGATDVGAVDGNQVIEFVIALKLRAPDELRALTTAQADPGSSLFHHFLSPAEFADRFGVSPSDYQRVVDWAQANRLEVVRPAAGRATLSLRGRAADVERAFHTRIDWFQDAQGLFRAPVRPLTPDIADLFAGAAGLDDAGRWFSHLAPPPSPDAFPSALAPADLRTLYDADPLPGHGEGETVAILGTGYPPFLKSDVDGFVAKYQLATKFGTNRFAQYTQVFVGGPNRDDDALANNEYGENLLDIDMVLGMAPRANVIHVFTATNSPGLFTDGIDFIVNNVPQAHAVSVSYGSCERYAATEAVTMNTLFQQAELEGQEWFFSSGDDGTDGCQDGRPNKILATDWPASSPHVMGVGGTELTSATTEIAWAGGGGGESELFAKPAYQAGVGPLAGDGARDVPDIAALAGSPGAAVFAQGQSFALEGTSAAAPMWAGMWALLDQSQGGKGLGGHTALYEAGLKGVCFHDITTGSNGNGVTPGYPALPGYDLATGWGSPDLAQLAANWP